MAIMSDLNIVAIKEGQVISDDIIKDFHLDLHDVNGNMNFEKICSFCGVVRRENSILISFPKNYIDLNEFNCLTIAEKIKHIRLLLKVIVEYEINPDYSKFRKKNEVNTFFSFGSFFNVYNFFQKYGLYTNKKSTLRNGYSGKVSWKYTMKKSPKVISGGNLIFVPFVMEKDINDEDFITNCMVFVINYTVKLFGDLIDLPDNSTIASRGIDMSLENNRRAVIVKLETMRINMFKDIDKELVANLIIFFRGVNSNYHNVSDVKYYYFNNIWEKAVEKYLNNHFVTVDKDKLIFNNIGKNYKFSKPVLKNYNSSHPNDTLQPDHYYYDRDKDIQYIFDSKYYNKINNLNHKQFVYHVLLSNRAKKTYDALILPSETSTRTEIHLNLASDYWFNESEKIKILLTHLNTQDVLKNFIN